MEAPPHARAGWVGRGHRFAAYPRCSADLKRRAWRKDAGLIGAQLEGEPVKWLLRIIAVWHGLGVLLCGLILVLLATHAVHRVRVGPIVLVGMIGTLLLGGFASLQLWRLRQSGRYATLGLLAFWATLWLAAATAGQGATGRSLLRLGVLVLVAAIVVLPTARRACR
jgi:hypothetical protein